MNMSIPNLYYLHNTKKNIKTADVDQVSKKIKTEKSIFPNKYVHMYAYLPTHSILITEPTYKYFDRS